MGRVSVMLSVARDMERLRDVDIVNESDHERLSVSVSGSDAVKDASSESVMLIDKVLVKDGESDQESDAVSVKVNVGVLLHEYVAVDVPEMDAVSEVVGVSVAVSVMESETVMVSVFDGEYE